MKIHVTGPGRTAQTRRAGKAARAKTGAEFVSHLQSKTTASPTAATTPPAVDGLFALQEVRDATDETSLAKAFAEKLLDQVDELRHALLAGSISPAQLRELQDFVHLERVRVTDPQLAEVLDEIELRASVELAKYQTVPLGSERKGGGAWSPGELLGGLFNDLKINAFLAISCGFQGHGLAFFDHLAAARLATYTPQPKFRFWEQRRTTP